MSNKTFYTHIAGLRGIAILLVIWFHFTSGNSSVSDTFSLPLGYFGVDIFLVIMGYFLFLGFRNKKNLEFKSFLSKKAYRILYPLSISLIVSIIFIAFLCDKYDIKSNTLTGLYALLCSSNWHLMITSKGYFVEDSSFNPFLHTWYVGVAMQSFILFFLGHVLLKYKPKKIIIAVCVVIALFSFIFYNLDNVRILMYRMGIGPAVSTKYVSYYATLPRLWELIIGGMILFMPEIKSAVWKNLLTLTAFFVILLASFRHSGGQYLTLFVVVGTLPVIRYGGETLLAKLLCNPILVGIGTISFSLYLIHMPAIALYKVYFFENPNLTDCILLLLSCLLVSYIFFRFVEKDKVTLKKLSYSMLIGLILCGSLLYVSSMEGFRSDKNYKLATYDSLKEYGENDLDAGMSPILKEVHDGWFTLTSPEKTKAPDLKRPLISLGNTNMKPTFVLLGDSHAQHLLAGMDVLCRGEDIRGVYLATTIIPLWNRELPRITTGYFYNREKAVSLMDWLSDNPQIEVVIIAQLWHRLTNNLSDWNNKPVSGDTFNGNAEALKEFCIKLRSINKRVICFYPEPHFKGKRMLNYMCWLMNNGQEKDEYILTREQYEEMFMRINLTLKSLEDEKLITLINPALCFFENGMCRPAKNGKLWFKDNNHFTVEGSIKAVNSFKNELLPLLQK